MIVLVVHGLSPFDTMDNPQVMGLIYHVTVAMIPPLFSVMAYRSE